MTTKWEPTETEMWVRVDGIQTRFIETKHAFPEIRTVCECGYRIDYVVGAHRLDWSARSKEDVLAALRFHYTHCRLARLPEITTEPEADRP